MKTFFFFGTLAHRPLLEIVLGRVCVSANICDAELSGYQAHWVKDQAYPFLEASKDASAKGLLVSRLSSEDLDRLAYYEAGYAYDIQHLSILSSNGPVQASVFFPISAPVKGAPWRLQDWCAEYAPLALLAAQEAMSYYGQIDGQTLAERFGPIRMRAASVLRAQTHQRDHDFSTDLARKDVRIDIHTRPYCNFFNMQEFDLQFTKYNGDLSEKVNRATFTGFDVACVLPYDPVEDCVLLVEQFRLGPFARGEDRPWSIEPVCGHVDVGESPQAAAHRECMEEAGVAPSELIEVSQAYPSPGCSTEYFYSYIGLCNLKDIQEGINGLDSEAENIRSQIVSYQALMEYVDSRAANNLILIMMANWLARHRDRLRQNAGL